ncbi:MAG: hypothetical protein JW750_05965, partial [Anaerolineaceae bacterium]|nr:hypothetical protein [Anaerolineaceae bacterium]
YFANESSPQPMWDYYRFDRPFAGLYYWAAFQLIGTAPLIWHIASFLVRYLGLIGLYSAFHTVWRGERQSIQLIVLLLSVFPGFTQFPITLAYFRIYTAFTLFTWSLALTMRAFSSKKKFAWAFSLLAVVLSLAQCLLVEYFVLLELLRLILICDHIHQQTPKPLRQILPSMLRIYLPYLAVLMLYFGYRFLFFETLIGVENANSAVIVEQITQGNLGALVDLVQISLQDMLAIVFQSYQVLFDPATIQAKGYIYLSFLVGLAVTILVYPACRPQGAEDNHQPQKWMFIGAACLILGGLPVWLMGRQSFVGLWSDRFILGPMVGAVLLIVGFINWVGKSSHRSVLVISILIGLSATFQIRNNVLYEQEWEQQRAFYWQLHWRAPALEPGTLVISPDLPLSHVSDYALGVAVNYLYADENLAPQPDYWFINSSHLFGLTAAAALTPDRAVNDGIRSIAFESDLSQVIGVSANSQAGRCLRLIDEPYSLFTPFSEFEAIENRLYRLSKPEQWITRNERTLPTAIFGKEPAHEWCYYFQKADLARQNGDWKTVLTLMDEAARLGYATKFGWESVPALMAYANTGDWEAFEDLAIEIRGRSKADNFTNFVRYVDANTPDSTQKDTAIQHVLAAYDY